MIRNKPQFVKILSVSLIIFIALLVVSLGANIIRYISLTSRENALKSELARLEQTASNNQTEIEYKQTSDYTDRYARENLDMSKKDEEVFVGTDEE